MPNREELHSLVDSLPEEKLEKVATMLRFAINPPQPMPELQKMQERTARFREEVEKRFRETRRSSCVGGMTGGGSFAAKEGAGYGTYSCRDWDGDAQVQQTLRFFKGPELETMPRFSISPDGDRLIYEDETASGGRTVRRTEEFPFHP